MNFFDSMRSWFIFVTGVLVRAALDAYNHWLPLGWLGDALRYLSDFTAAIAGYLYDASWWYEGTTTAIGQILSWETLKNLIQSWLAGIEDAISWIQDWWGWVGQRIDYWWQSELQTVRDWIAAATQGFDQLKAAWDNFTRVTLRDIFDQFELLRANWNQFWAVTFPSLVSFTWLSTWWNSRLQDVQSLIDSAFTIREDIWTGWQELRDQVVDFFADPWAWLYERLDDFIERFW